MQIHPKAYLQLISRLWHLRVLLSRNRDPATREASPLLIYIVIMLALLLTVLEADLHRELLQSFVPLGAPAEIVVQPFDTLLMKFAESVGAQIIVRGLRAVADFEYEFAMVGMNQKLNPAIETVFLMADPTHQAIASRLVKEIARLQGSVSQFVPQEVERRLKAKFGVS